MKADSPEGDHPSDHPGDHPGNSGAADAPDLLEALRELRATGGATLGAGKEAASALRILVSADVSLARSAFGRTLALTGAAIAFGASAWLLLMAALITYLSRHAGLTWTWSLLLTAALSLVATALACWWATRYFEYTRMKATRRQLSRLGIGELAGLIADSASQQSSNESAEAFSKATQDKPVKKGMGVDVTPP